MKEIIKLLLRENIEYQESECDCCSYFDMNSIQRFGGFEHPIYFVIAKREIHKLVYISPKQYMYNIARGFGISYQEAMGSAYNDEKAEKYALMMKNGSKAPIGFYVENKPDQEGRHRAAAALKLNCSLIPVVKINNGLDNNYVRDFVLNIKDLKEDELNALFINKGYSGISKLDWNELQRYINYVL